MKRLRVESLYSYAFDTQFPPKIDYNHYNPNARYLPICEKCSMRKC